jgi:PAS domain S-box-containing protein
MRLGIDSIIAKVWLSLAGGALRKLLTRAEFHTDKANRQPVDPLTRIDSVISELRGDDSAKELLRAWSKAAAMIMVSLPDDSDAPPAEERIPPGRILFASLRAEEMFGYVEGRLQGRDFTCLIPERFRKQHEAHFREFGSNPKNRTMGTGGQLYGLRSDGSEIPIEIGLHPTTFSRVFCAIGTVVESRPGSPTGGCPVKHG